MCKIFAISLKGAALTWFDSLKPESIHSFKELVNHFGAHFASSMKVKREANHLFTITQGRNESLKACTQRFNKEKVSILDCNESIAIEAFRKGLLRENHLYESLTKRLPEMMLEVMSQAVKYINLEEDRKMEKRDTARNIKKDKLIIEVNRTIPQQKLVRPLRPQTKVTKADRRKQDEISDPFKYYSLMISLKQCRQLKWEIKALIKRGLLKEFIPKGKKPDIEEEEPQNKYDNIINSIHGDFACGGALMREREKHIKLAQVISVSTPNQKNPKLESTPLIVFSDHDMKGLHMPHDDALIIKTDIVNKWILRILVDSGNSINVSFLSMLNKMKWNSDNIEKFNAMNLVRFNGETSRVMGKIIVPILTKVMKFLIGDQVVIVKNDQKVKQLLGRFEEAEIKQLPRDENSHADALANIASSIKFDQKRTILIGYLPSKSIAEEENLSVHEQVDEESWMTPIIEYINNGIQPSDKSEARKLRIK
ncbi:uncharacterized protein LOC107424188 [Ziziphus jujuba]|uniref:Uncharacterized protein LOC107424188 n=1 Tax=Ziziphus jujuba TaxID=326968 RepID=A0A6P4A5T3_ZIZJJ|nr:uncharacterized protein LOC107424188 [Ziziphus jujuba]